MPECTFISNAPITDATFKTFAAHIRRALTRIHAEMPLKDVSILLERDGYLRELNHQFRGMDKPTNVLSFASDAPDYLGDIAISLDTLQREALEQVKPLDHHFTHMIIHGILHLLGYDHEQDVDAEAMEALEINILQQLSIPNLYNFP